jgi:transposase
VSIRPKYSKEFKEAIVQKVINRGTRSIGEVCEQEGIHESTAKNWLRGCAIVPGMKKQISAKKWSAERKLKAVSETLTSSEEVVGAYLRKEGLYSHQLKEWRSQMLAAVETRPQRLGAVRDARDARITELERDLARMEKALAEASARMMLQKKADLFWTNRDAERK